MITKRDIESAMYGRKNEIYQSTSKIVPKAALILRDVCYYIEAHFVLTDQRGLAIPKINIMLSPSGV